MSFLRVPGARLYYETLGQGPLMLMIPGANGVADGFRPVAEHLAERYTVLSYDRRGFSRSEPDGPQDHDHRLETDADDARSLIEHLSGDEPATVFGTSSGAIVALTLLARHPSVVGTLIAFEPPAVRLLPDGEDWVDAFTQMYELYRTAGAEPALAGFRERTFPPSDRRAMAHAPRNESNAAYWFEHELRQYPAVTLDLDALKAHADRIHPAAGRDGEGYPAHDATMALARRLDRSVIDLPGGHVGFLSHTDEFARRLLLALPHPRLPGAMSHKRTSPKHMSPKQWDDLYSGMPDWDLGRPQPTFRDLAESGAIRGRVLDVGCGTGEHVLLCASLGLDATGIDFAPAALEAAEAKAHDRDLTARFLLHDARKLTDLHETFDTVLDCGLFHTFDDEELTTFVDSVRSVMAAGGRYFLLCFSDRQPGEGGPRRFTRDELLHTFANGWRIDSVEPVAAASTRSPAGMQAWLVAVTKT